MYHCLEACGGVKPRLSEMTGHYMIAFTFHTYAHSGMDIKRKALETMKKQSLEFIELMALYPVVCV